MRIEYTPKVFSSEHQTIIDTANAEFGTESWELDALDPATISDLIRTETLALVDDDLWQRAIVRENEGTELLEATSRNWSQVASFVGAL